MKYFFIAMYITFTLSPVFGSGRAKIPQDYIDIGQLDLTINKTNDTIFLPYIKPFGIKKIITSSVQGLLIENIIVDGKNINPKRMLFDMGAYEAISHLNERDVNIDEAQFVLPMRWQTYTGGSRTYDEWLNEGIHFDYFSRNGKIKYSPDKYNIPYGSKEVFIIYKIRFPDYSSESQLRNYITSEKTYTAKFNVIWPEIRVADRRGRILPPDDYENLGLYKFNLENEIIVELPFNEIDNPHIDSRWLKVYQLIADGLLIKKQRLNNNEKNHVDTLTEQADIQNGETTIEMTWRVNENIKHGVVFYSKAENPPIKYIVPYGCKEAYLIYDILFKEPHSTGAYTNYNKRLCVKWEIEWN